MKHLFLSIMLVGFASGFVAKAQTLAPKKIDSLLRKHFADSNFVIIDVCTDGVYAAGHIQNAIHRDLNASNLISDLDTMNKSKLYLLHCISGGRSLSAMNTMKSKGFTQVFDISGGINNWRTTGFATTPTTTQSKIRFLGAKDFAAKLKQTSSPTIVDLQADSLFEEQHLSNAVHCDTTKNKLQSLCNDKTKPYFIYGSQVSALDSAAMYQLYWNAYSEVYILNDGFKAWKEAGYEYEKKANTSTALQQKSINTYQISTGNGSITITPTEDAPISYYIYSIDGQLLQTGIVQTVAKQTIATNLHGVFVLQLYSAKRSESVMVEL